MTVKLAYRRLQEAFQGRYSTFLFVFFSTIAGGCVKRHCAMPPSLLTHAKPCTAVLFSPTCHLNNFHHLSGTVNQLIISQGDDSASTKENLARYTKRSAGVPSMLVLV
jgi:hypothetical protein